MIYAVHYGHKDTYGHGHSNKAWERSLRANCHFQPYNLENMHNIITCHILEDISPLHFDVEKMTVWPCPVMSCSFRWRRVRVSST